MIQEKHRSHPRVLIVDDDAGMRFVLEEFLTREGYECVSVSNGQEALERMNAHGFPIVLMDIKMPKLGGLPALEEMRRSHPNALVILMTAFGSRAIALEAVEKGAYDYFTKPFDLDEMRIVLKRATERVHLNHELTVLREQVNGSGGSVLGRSESLRRMMAMVDKVAVSDATVLISGESGTGKELIARAIHERSARADRAFQVVSCASLPESLLEMELFGYEKGAYTGADHQKPGKFELAQGGTIFLDEIGELKGPIQSKILRVLQEREVDRIGGMRPIRVDVRFLAATQQDLSALVASGTFREDLFFRLNVLTIQIDPLRHRLEDIPPLAEHFLSVASERFKKRVTKITPSAMNLLLRYPWPGNVREVENVMQRGVVLADSDQLDEAILEEILPQGSSGHLPQMSGPLKDKMGEFRAQTERKIIEETLRLEDGRRAATARRLGISRKNLYNKMKKYGLL